MSESLRNVVIIGSGCAGNTAAIYTARAGLQPLVVIGHEPGGQLSITTEVENFPGFPEGVLGPELVENMKRQAAHFGAEFLDGLVEQADLSKRPFRLRIEEQWVETRTLIVASGASARWLGLPNEQKLIGHGVSSCATSAVSLKNVKTGEEWREPVDGLFLAIGHIPNTKPFAGTLDLDPEGYIVSHGGARTSVLGVFHAGDVQDRVYRQAITAAGAGCMAAIEAERFLEAQGH